MFRLVGIFIVLTIGCSLGSLAPVTANEAPKQTTENQPSAAQGAASAAGGEQASDLVKKRPKGQLKNPYQDFAKVADEGHKKFMSAGRDGCHGGTGGGSMCPPLTGQLGIYGSDDDTLFPLIALGSDELQKQGYSRKLTKSVVGPMPPLGQGKTADDIWKIIAWIPSINPSSASGEQRQHRPRRTHSRCRDSDGG